MGSETVKVPVIDLRKVRESDSATWESTKIRVFEAAQEYGCFEVIHDSIPLDMQKSLIDGLQQFFDMSPEKKRSYNSGNFNCYIGGLDHSPLYETFGIKDALSIGADDDFIKNAWPQGYPTFSKSMKLYCEHLSEIDKMVRRMVLESLGLEKYMEEHMNSATYDISAHKYSVPTPGSKAGLKVHDDLSFITIVHELNQVGGLEFLTKDGKNWISPNASSPNSSIVVIGTSFHAWTNGRLHPVTHKVIMSGDKPRYSFLLFVIPKPNIAIKAPEEIVDEEHPLLYKPFLFPKLFELYPLDGLSSINTLQKYFAA